MYSVEGSSPLTGENADRDGTVYSVEGSSPLTRGKLAVVLRATHAGGLIPAHAGKTLSSALIWSPSAAHPRSRGENIASRASWLVIGGSSPLTRGKPLIQARRIHAQGLIPAHAGKTNGTPIRSDTCEAHPRSRGENHG